MNFNNWFREIPNNAIILACCGVFLLSGLISYFFYEDTKIIEKRIFSRQKDLALTIQLRDLYEFRKQALEKPNFKTNMQLPLSLTIVEEMVREIFVGVRLVQLQPTTTKESKGDRKTTVEVKVTGAPLNEVTSFIKLSENSGFQISRLRLSLPSSNPMALDMQATIVERRNRG
jgi:hypothetical protein